MRTSLAQIASMGISGRLGVITALAVFLTTACQSAAPAPTATAVPKAASPTSAPVAQQSGSSVAAGDLTEWNKLLEAARAEGTVSVSFPPAVPTIGDSLGEAFKADTGVKLEYITDAAAHTRMEQEYQAGKVTTDVVLSGATELLNLYPLGAMVPIRLVHPEVKDPSKWADGKMKWVDKSQQLMPIPVEWVTVDLMVNAKVVDPKTITSWKDLLKPEYKGKIVLQAFNVGAGGATAADMLENFGPDFVTKLYQEQTPLVTRDPREVVESAARGTHPIALAVYPNLMEDFKKQGFDLQRVFPSDGRMSVVGGSGVPKIIKNSPHPNAAQLFVNWLMTKRGQELWARGSLEPSRRVDVASSEVPDYIKPKPGVQYREQYEEEYYLKIRPQMRTQLEQLLGR